MPVQTTAVAETHRARPPSALQLEPERLIAALIRISSAEGREDAAALRAQSQQARRQAKDVSRRRTR